MLNRWKVLACTLSVGVGGLAVFATPPANPKDNKEPSPLPTLTVKPASSPKGADTAPSIKPVEELDLDIPVVPAPSDAKPKLDPKAKKAPVFEEIDDLPSIVVPAKSESREPIMKEEQKKVTLPPPPSAVPAPVAPTTPSITIPDFPADSGKPTIEKTPSIDITIPSPKVSEPVRIDPPIGPLPKPEIGLTPPAPTVESPKAPSTSVEPIPSKLKMLVRMGDAKPRFEIRNVASQELLIKVYGERIEMQTPPDGKTTVAGVSAVGNVRFTAPGIEGVCDHLTMLSATGEVLLKGNIRLRTKYGKTWNEMTAEKMVYQIGSLSTAPQTPNTVSTKSAGLVHK